MTCYTNSVLFKGKRLETSSKWPIRGKIWVERLARSKSAASCDSRDCENFLTALAHCHSSTWMMFSCNLIYLCAVGGCIVLETNGQHLFVWDRPFGPTPALTIFYKVVFVQCISHPLTNSQAHSVH